MRQLQSVTISTRQLPFLSIEPLKMAKLSPQTAERLITSSSPLIECHSRGCGLEIQTNIEDLSYNLTHRDGVSGEVAIKKVFADEWIKMDHGVSAFRMLHESIDDAIAKDLLNRRLQAVYNTIAAAEGQEMKPAPKVYQISKPIDLDKALRTAPDSHASDKMERFWGEFHLA